MRSLIWVALPSWRWAAWRASVAFIPAAAIFFCALGQMEFEFVAEIAVEFVAMEEGAEAGEKLF